jgi:hypothetical protein
MPSIESSSRSNEVRPSVTLARLHWRARLTRIAAKAIMKPGKQFALTKRGLCWSTAISFLFFLVFSAPHRVHHLYEQLPSPVAQHVAHDHSDSNDRGASDNQPASKPTDCVVLSVAQSAHISSVSSFDLPVFETAAARCADHPIVAIKAFNTSAGAPRAPPRF